MPVVTTAEYMADVVPEGTDRTRTCPDVARPGTRATEILSDVSHRTTVTAQQRGDPVLTKVFPIEWKAGRQAEAEELVLEFAPKGPGAEDGTLSFRVYRDPARPD